MGYIPHTDAEKEDMLRAIGVESFTQLLSDIPEEVRLSDGLKLPDPLSELEARAELRRLARKNASCENWTCFAGGGVYDHYVPSVVDKIASREEFYTAYTPYQSEISQGTLQTIYEYQSLIARLTGMEVSNASLYDGGTALAEAAFMASAINCRKEIVVSPCVNPMRLALLETYLRATGLEIKVADSESGWTDPEDARSLVSEKTCCLIIENPNFFGIVEDGGRLAKIAHAVGALLVASVDPISLGVLAEPSKYGADIVVGEGQPLGNRLSFGGPCLGFMATRREYIRRLPGRIVGKTIDRDGRPCYCLTLQTREQHIRREKATSNICTNQALNALRAAVYLSWLGKEGLREVATLCLSKAVYAQKALASVGFGLRFHRPFFKEFVVDLPCKADRFMAALAGQRILGGIPLGRYYSSMTNSVLISFTEKRTREEIDRLASTMKQLGEIAETKR
jgi:glycine dehydrogenase subunit 1